MVNGSQCKISGAVGHAWEYAHAQWADDRVAALHMHGGLRMRSKRTTTWQLLTRSQIETKLIVSLCFWSDYQHLSQAYGCFWSMYFNPSLSGMMSRRWTTSPPNGRHFGSARLTGPALKPQPLQLASSVHFICTCAYSPVPSTWYLFHM